MAFFMPAFVAVNRLLYFFAWLLLCNTVQAEPHFRIVQASIKSQPNADYLLDAIITYPLTPRVIEAIENGIPITFNQTLRISEPYFFLGQLIPWRKTYWSTTYRHRLRYHSLSGQYILQSFSPREQHNYPDLDTALEELGRLEQVTLALPDSPSPQAKLELQTEIDIHALPTPMRPGALISSKWQIASPWTEISWPN